MEKKFSSLRPLDEVGGKITHCVSCGNIVYSGGIIQCRRSQYYRKILRFLRKKGYEITIATSLKNTKVECSIILLCDSTNQMSAM